MFSSWIRFIRTLAGGAVATTAAVVCSLPQLAAAQDPPEIVGFRFEEAVVAGCQNAGLEITLMRPAPAGGVVVRLESDSPLIKMPANAKIAAGKLSRQIAVKTTAVSSETVVFARGTLAGRTVSTPLRVRPIGVAKLTLSRKAVPGGDPVQATATLECAAAPGPIQVELESDNPTAVAAIPSTVTVPAGQLTATFDIVTSGVESNTRQTLQATASGISQSKSLTTTTDVSIDAASLCGTDDSAVIANRAGGIRTTAAGNLSCRWRKDHLLVTFADGDAGQQQKVRTLTDQWASATHFTFEFGFGFSGDVVISFTPSESGNPSSYIGTCRDRSKPVTMHLPGIGSGTAVEESEQRTVLHEFGHALGLIHEHQNPALGPVWNVEYLLGLYPGYPREKQMQRVQANYLDKPLALNYTAFDVRSIMKYQLSPAMFKNAAALAEKYGPDLFRWNTELSFMDKAFVRVWPTTNWAGYLGPEDQYLFGNWDGGVSGYGVQGDRPAVRRGNEILFSLNRDGEHDFVQLYGNHTDRWIAGDWDGDGRDTLATIRGNCVYYDNNNDDQHEFIQCYGNHGSTYLVGDWDGDKKDNIAVVDGNCVNMDTNFDNAHDFRQCYGNHGERYLVGDWNGDGRDNLAVLRGNCVVKDYNFDGAHDAVQCYGNIGDIYVVGDWNGDGLDNLANLRGNCLYMDHNNDNAHDAVHCYGNGPSPFAIWSWDAPNGRLIDDLAYPIDRRRLYPADTDDRRPASWAANG